MVANLAVVWALEQKRSVAVLDVDPQGSLGEWFERREDREDRLGEDWDRADIPDRQWLGGRRV